MIGWIITISTLIWASGFHSTNIPLENEKKTIQEIQCEKSFNLFFIFSHSFVKLTVMRLYSRFLEDMSTQEICNSGTYFFKVLLNSCLQLNIVILIFKKYVEIQFEMIPLESYQKCVILCNVALRSIKTRPERLRSLFKLNNYGLVSLRESAI